MSQMKLSLSVITGNCERDVERFLDVFQPFFDEVVMVRAVGKQSPDKTLEIAEARGCITGQYRNAVCYGATAKRQDWPHVDDFAAARNASAALCTGDWIMWADMDDDATGLETLRETLANLPPDIGLLRCPYVVGEQGVESNYRERVWRNSGEYEWVNAIHENLARKDRAQERQGKTDRLRIIHAPRSDRDCTQDRNMRILESIPEDDRTHGHTFYLMTEYARRKDARAIETAQRFLAHPESATPERFETFMTLAHMAEDADQKAAIYTQAFTEDPSRAEPLYELTALSLACDNPERALSYARHMMTCQWPENPCWNHRRMFYSFFREDLFLQCLRATGRILESDTHRDNMLALEKLAGKTTISLIHATRGRPAQAARCRMEWLRLADSPERIEHIFAVDADDEYMPGFQRFPSVVMAGDGGPVAAWNAAAKISKGDILIQLSDDWKPTKGWDSAIIQAIGDTEMPSVLAINDGHRKDDLLCMAILTRARYEQQGHMFHPEFFSMFSDNWFSGCAFRDGVVIDARDRITFEHVHPAFGKSEMDATYQRTNAAEHYRTGKATIDRLMSGTCVSSAIDGWCDFRSLYTRIAEALPEGARIAEVGSWQGQSIVWLCQRIQDLGKAVAVHCVDTWAGEQNQPEHIAIVEAHGGSVLAQFKDNIRAAGVEDMITLHVGDSAERAADFEDASLDFIFIDAAHDYESVRKDLAAWFPKLKRGGIFAGHDYPWHEVERAVKEHAADHGYFVHQVGRCWISSCRLPVQSETVLGIMAHASARPTVEAFQTRWKTLDVDTRLFVPVGDEAAIEGATGIGENAYSGVKVFQRFLDTLEHLTAHPGAETIILAEYDTVNLTNRLPYYTPGGITSCFMLSPPPKEREGNEQLCALSPWIMDRETALDFIAAGRQHIEEHGDCGHIDGLLDRWIGEVITTHKLAYAGGVNLLGYPWRDGFAETVRGGKTWVHGFKTIEEFGEIWNEYKP
jgi:hypothetical protein